jgi:hypothetical protein
VHELLKHPLLWMDSMGGWYARDQVYKKDQSSLKVAICFDEMNEELSVKWKEKLVHPLEGSPFAVYMKTYREKKEPAFGNLKLSAQTFCHRHSHRSQNAGQRSK